MSKALIGLILVIVGFIIVCATIITQSWMSEMCILGVVVGGCLFLLGGFILAIRFEVWG